jgi:hypothetical protein
MRLCLHLLLLLFQSLIFVSSRKASPFLNLLKDALNQTFSEFEVPYPPSNSKFSIPSDFTQVEEICHGLKGTPDYNRVACCTPNDVRHIYNVLIEEKKMIFFVPDLKAVRKPNLPVVSSVVQQKKIDYQLPIEYREGPLIPSKHCQRYFNGTLHFPGRSTVHNIYHSSKFIDEISIYLI